MIKSILTASIIILCISQVYSQQPINNSSANHSAQSPNLISVYADKPGSSIQPTMWGIFFEDINFAADGGIYAELVKNRSFEFYKPLMGWKILKPDTTTGILIINQSKTNPANPRYARITLAEGEPSFGLSNAGFRGMGIKREWPIIFQF